MSHTAPPSSKHPHVAEAVPASVYVYIYVHIIIIYTYIYENVTSVMAEEMCSSVGGLSTF